MTWSYNLSIIANSSKDAVRLLIGDVVACDPQMQDEEIAYLVGLRGSLYGAAAECCRAMAAKFSRSVDQQGGTSKVFYSQMAKAYTLKSIEFDNKATMFGSGTPYAGGISLSDKQIQDLNDDRVPPAFTKGIMDNSIPMPSGANETVEQMK